jgi:hypothetical protein
MTTTRAKETVIGVVNDVSEPKDLGDGRWVPAKVKLKTDDGVDGELNFFPKKDWDTKVVHDPIQLGPTWDALVKLCGDPPDQLIGRTIAVTAVPKEEREGLAQWADAVGVIKVIGAQPKAPVETPVEIPVDTPVSKPSAKPPVVDRQDQIMLQHGTNVSAICYNAWFTLPVESRGTFSDYLREVAIGGTWLLENVYQPGGYTPQVFPEEEPEEGIDPATFDEGDPADSVLGTI